MLILFRVMQRCTRLVDTTSRIPSAIAGLAYCPDDVIYLRWLERGRKIVHAASRKQPALSTEAVTVTVADIYIYIYICYTTNGQ